MEKTCANVCENNNPKLGFKIATIIFWLELYESVFLSRFLVFSPNEMAKK